MKIKVLIYSFLKDKRILFEKANVINTPTYSFIIRLSKITEKDKRKNLQTINVISTQDDSFKFFTKEI